MSSDRNLWLPELIYPEIPGQIDDEYLDRLYAVFERDFILSKLEWEGPRFASKRFPEQFGWPATFWHLITEGPVESQRTYSVERAASITWLRPVIAEFVSVYPDIPSRKIRWWKNKRGTKERLLIATWDFEYLVVLSIRHDHLLLWTAYPTRRHTAIKLKREHDDYWQ